MTLTTDRAAAGLARFISHVWLYKNSGPGARQRVVPDGCAQIIVSLSGTPIMVDDGDGWRCFAGPVLAAPRTRPVTLDTANWGELIGVSFRPGGAAPFFRPPLHELADRTWRLEDLIGPAAADLHGRLLETPAPQQRRALMLGFLAERLAADFSPEDGVDFALARFRSGVAGPSVTTVVRESGLSHPRFIEGFRRQVGVTPKRFRRILRVQKAVRLLHSEREGSIAQVAVSCGYFDQAHLTNDFRSIAGVTPSEYRAARTEHANHLSLS